MSGMTTRVRTRIGDLGMVRTRSELNALAARIFELEEEVAECRRHHQRTAELTDIVQALLVPIARRDEAALEQLLRDYAERLG